MVQVGVPVFENNNHSEASRIIHDLFSQKEFISYVSRIISEIGRFGPTEVKSQVLQQTFEFSFLIL